MTNQFFQYSFNSYNNQKVKHIATLDPVQSDGLLKSIKAIVSLCNPTKIIITNSQAVHWLHDRVGLLCIDLKNLLDSEISFGIINQRGLSKSLSCLKNESDLTISTAYHGQVHRFVAGTSELNVPAAFIDRTELLDINFSDTELIGSIIKIDDTSLLTGKCKTTPVKIHLYAGQLSSVWFPDGSAYHFSKIALSEDSSHPDLSFRSYAFLRCAGKESSLKVLKAHDQHWLLTESLLGVGIQACLYEPLFSIF